MVQPTHPTLRAHVEIGAEVLKKRDLGGDIESAGTAVVVRPQRPTSFLLSDDLKAALRKRGQEPGVGYQTAAKMILAKYVNAKL